MFSAPVLGWAMVPTDAMEGVASVGNNSVSSVKLVNGDRVSGHHQGPRSPFRLSIQVLGGNPAYSSVHRRLRFHLLPSSCLRQNNEDAVLGGGGLAAAPASRGVCPGCERARLQKMQRIRILSPWTSFG